MNLLVLILVFGAGIATPYIIRLIISKMKDVPKP